MADESIMNALISTRLRGAKAVRVNKATTRY